MTGQGLFSPITFYADVPPPVFALDGYVSAAPARGTWPTRFGSPARNGRLGEPLLQDSWRVSWKAELGEASQPQSLLVGAGRVLVNGGGRRSLWLTDGTPVGAFQREVGTEILDLGGEHWLCAEQGGLATFSLDGAREAKLPLSLANASVLRQVLAGPGAFVFVSNQKPPQASARVLVECMRIVDYQNVENRTLYGVEPLAGLIREEDDSICAAASKVGPVLATSDGVCFCDWQLRTLREVPLSTIPLSLSVDDAGRALLVSDDYGELKLRSISPTPTNDPKTDLIELGLGSYCADAAPPLVAPGGQIYVSATDTLLALSPRGEQQWQQWRTSSAPCTVALNGLVLMADDQLYTLLPDGQRVALWKPPAPIRTAAVLADGVIYVATADELFALEPA